MMFADISRKGRPFAKDPAVVRFAGSYWLYHTLPLFGDGRDNDGCAIGIARSDDLETWCKVGEILPQTSYERNGLCAPGAIVLGDQVHLFYQTYGNGPKDAICHAVSDDGVHFIRNATNPIFAPAGDWTVGRAIDADVIVHGDRLFLYFATRDPAMRIQMLGVAAAPLDSDFGRAAWMQLCDAPILKPELPWEQECIEAPALCKRDGRFFMFSTAAHTTTDRSRSAVRRVRTVCIGEGYRISPSCPMGNLERGMPANPGIRSSSWMRVGAHFSSSRGITTWGKRGISPARKSSGRRGCLY